MAPRAGNPNRLAGQPEGIVAMAVLEGDVAEDEVRRVVGQGQGAAIGHMAGLEMIRLAELGNRLATPLQERGIEIAGHDLGEKAGEAGGHATDAATDLHDRLVGPVRTIEPEGLEVGEGLVVAGGHELGQADVIATVVEHPARLAYHRIGRVLGLGCRSGSLPWDVLSTGVHDLNSLPAVADAIMTARCDAGYLRSGRGAE